MPVIGAGAPCGSIGSASGGHHPGLPLEEDQPFDIVDQVRQPNLCARSRQPDRADEQPHSALLRGKDVLDAGPHLRLAGIGASTAQRHWPARRLFPVKARDEAALGHEALVGL